MKQNPHSPLGTHIKRERKRDETRAEIIATFREQEEEGDIFCSRDIACKTEL